MLLLVVEVGDCKRVACQVSGGNELRLGSRNEQKNESCPLAGVLCKATDSWTLAPFPRQPSHCATQITHPNSDHQYNLAANFCRMASKSS